MAQAARIGAFAGEQEDHHPDQGGVRPEQGQLRQSAGDQGTEYGRDSHFTAEGSPIDEKGPFTQQVDAQVRQPMHAGITVVAAYKMALSNRSLRKGMIFHSDRGVQYACNEFRELLRRGQMVVQSMSRKGNCWDNAVAESFFKSLKAE